MALYQVRVWTMVYVEADSELEANETAETMFPAIIRGESEWEFETDYEVTTLRDVRHGWDGECYPYRIPRFPLRTIAQVLGP